MPPTVLSQKQAPDSLGALVRWMHRCDLPWWVEAPPILDCLAQAVAMDQTQTRIRNPPTSVPSSKPTFTNRRSRAKTFPSWFMVAPQRNRWFTWSRMVVVLASPTSERNEEISVRKRCVRLIKPHLEQCAGEGSEAWMTSGVALQVHRVQQSVATRVGVRGKEDARFRGLGLFGCCRPRRVACQP